MLSCLPRFLPCFFNKNHGTIAIFGAPTSTAGKTAGHKRKWQGATRRDGNLQSERMEKRGQWIILVLVIGGRDFITPQEAIYTWYISGMYCQLGDYILPTTLYKNLKNPLTGGQSSTSTLQETNSKSTWKMNGWNTIVSFWGRAYFQVQTCC